MHVFHAIELPAESFDKAFDVLTAETGASYFRDIGTYSSYTVDGHRIRVEYPTLWGVTKITMSPSRYRVAFQGSAPGGVTFGGSWYRCGGHMHLEQTVRGVPWFGRGLVRTRLVRALEDLRKAVEQESP